MTEAANPYSAPTARVEDTDAGEAETIRKAHLGHETSVKGAGGLYLLGGTLMTLGGVAVLFGSSAGGAADAAVSAFVLALGMLQIWAGLKVRALQRGGRTAGAVLSGLGLLAFPLGTLINGYILWLFFSDKGKTVFSDAYKDVIAATPHVKAKTSIVVWIFLALLLGLLVLGVGAVVLG